MRRPPALRLRPRPAPRPPCERRRPPPRPLEDRPLVLRLIRFLIRFLHGIRMLFVCIPQQHSQTAGQRVAERSRHARARCTALPLPAPRRILDSGKAKSVMARAFWKGSISFGLVHIPIALHSAESPEE